MSSTANILYIIISCTHHMDGPGLLWPLSISAPRVSADVASSGLCSWSGAASDKQARENASCLLLPVRLFINLKYKWCDVFFRLHCLTGSRLLVRHMKLWTPHEGVDRIVRSWKSAGKYYAWYLVSRKSLHQLELFFFFWKDNNWNSYDLIFW